MGGIKEGNSVYKKGSGFLFSTGYDIRKQVRNGDGESMTELLRLARLGDDAFNIFSKSDSVSFKQINRSHGQRTIDAE